MNGVVGGLKHEIATLSTGFIVVNNEISMCRHFDSDASQRSLESTPRD
jgi:hypothetical protein